MINIIHVMQSLSEQRKAFHSEADFQHAIAWKFQQMFESARIRLEKPLRKEDGKTDHLDVLIELPNNSIAVELKYKTKNLQVKLGDEDFKLANQGAQDIGRYDFIKDVCRLEHSVLKEKSISEGFAILLTNDSRYWKPATKNTVDTAFRLHDENRRLSGSLGWGDASEGTMKNRKDNHQIVGDYALKWRDYSVTGEIGNGTFRYLALHITK